MPKTSGQLQLPISGPAVVRRDARGIPHIGAANWQDAMFLQGYVTAQDRLWQMDGLRRYGSGTLAEISGPGAVPLDELSRKQRMRAVAEADVQHLTPEERVIFVEYARGVNEFIDTHRSNYSLEFSLPGHVYDPKPWTLVDSAVVGLVLYRNLTDNAAFKYSKAQFVGMADPARARLLFPALGGRAGDSGLECMGGFRRPYCFRQAAAGERSTFGVRHSAYLVSGAFEGSGPERDGSFAAGFAVCDCGAQRTDCVGRNESRDRFGRFVSRAIR